MNNELILAKLNADQIRNARAANGSRKRITHALICGQYGRIYGTEKQCLKYFEAWNPRQPNPIFPALFSTARKVDHYEINDYRTTFNLVMKLITVQDSYNQSPL